MNNHIRKKKVPNTLKLNVRMRTMAAIISSILLLLTMIVSGLMTDLEKLDVNFAIKNLPPTLQHPFGTDWMGRDMFVRTIKGLSLSFGVGLLAAIFSTLNALVLSLLASWNQFTDRCVTWLIDLFLSLPHIVTLLLIAFAAGGGFRGVVLGLALTHWPSLTRLLRAELLQIKQAEYAEVSRQLGKSRRWIARYHFLPHLMPQLFVGFILLFPHAILHEAAITFLGFGLPAEQPALGVILSESMRYLSAGSWWLAVFPGLALILMVALFDLLGKSLRQWINPVQSIK